jgi:hypothetical protein
LGKADCGYVLKTAAMAGGVDKETGVDRGGRPYSEGLCTRQQNSLAPLATNAGYAAKVLKIYCVSALALAGRFRL